MLGHGGSLALPAPCRRSPLSEESPLATKQKTTPQTTRVRGIANGPRAAAPRLLDPRHDTPDFRDRMLEPTPGAVPHPVPRPPFTDTDVPLPPHRPAGLSTPPH